MTTLKKLAREKRNQRILEAYNQNQTILQIAGSENLHPGSVKRILREIRKGGKK